MEGSPEHRDNTFEQPVHTGYMVVAWKLMKKQRYVRELPGVYRFQTLLAPWDHLCRCRPLIKLPPQGHRRGSEQWGIVKWDGSLLWTELGTGLLRGNKLFQESAEFNDKAWPVLNTLCWTTEGFSPGLYNSSWQGVWKPRSWFCWVTGSLPDLCEFLFIIVILQGDR